MTEEHKQYPPEAIANNILWLAHREGVPVDPMKLLKLVYIVYGWSLALLKRKLFNDPIEAWKLGPVVPSIYYQFQRFGRDPIPPGEYAYKNQMNDENGEIIDTVRPILDQEDEDVLRVLGVVWRAYKGRKGMDLSRLTHTPDGAWEKAWKKGRNTPLDDKDILRRSIEGINKFYEKK
jgi:uncharacterized phage-associated protein